ncbi:type IV pilus assembly protein PilV [Solilutibacter tolerans]|uniref:Type IV pilus assembly protein PilV n=2 Tax=Solilutibacter tolerans TaxID=1604334 RepID=A0A1N6NS26_9GAMM|nr:type IV pilus assembly protein PilV [Lysobacter tolerans]
MINPRSRNSLGQSQENIPMRTSAVMTSRSRQSGFSLIEVMVAVLVLSIGLLGLAALQATALRNNQSALERSQGVVNTYSMLDAMRANVDSARAGEYVMSETCTVPAANTSLVQKDKRAWIQMIQANLGNTACGTVTCSGSLCTVTVTWDDRRGKGGEEKQQFSTEVQI